MTDTPKHGDFRVWYIPQVPMKAFTYPAPDLETAALIIDAIVNFSIFEFENRVKPDYADAAGIERYEENFDGEGNDGWTEVDTEEYEGILS